MNFSERAMRRRAFLLLVLLLASARCGSSGSDLSVELIPPRLRIREAAGMLRPWKDQMRVPMNLLVDVFNDSSESIVLKRLVIQSSPASMSGMKFDPSTRDVPEVIPPNGVRTVEVWISAWVELPNLDAGTQTTIRATAYFDSELGRFRRVFNVPILPHGANEMPRSE